MDIYFDKPTPFQAFLVGFVSASLPFLAFIVFTINPKYQKLKSCTCSEFVATDYSGWSSYKWDESLLKLIDGSDFIVVRSPLAVNHKVNLRGYKISVHGNNWLKISRSDVADLKPSKDSKWLHGSDENINFSEGQ